MKKALGAVVVMTGLIVVTGCARSERWTLDGSTPQPLNDRKDLRPEIRMPQPAEDSEEVMLTRNVELVAENDFAVARNKGDVTAVATVQVTPGEKNMPPETARKIQVLVPARSDVRVGRMSGAGENGWSYRIVRVEAR